MLFPRKEPLTMEFSKTTFQKCGNMHNILLVSKWNQNKTSKLCKQEIRMNKPKTGPIDALDVHSWLVFVFMFVTVKLHTVCKIAKGFLFCFHYGKIPLAWKLWGVLKAVSVKIIIPWPFCFWTNVDNHLKTTFTSMSIKLSCKWLWAC